MRNQSTSTAKRPVASAMAAPFAQYQAARAEATDQFMQHHRVQSLWRALTRAMDALLVSVTAESRVTLIAVGGYGRGELFPFSDIDLLILTPETGDSKVDASVTRVLQCLWDQQIPVSHATRSIAETVEAATRDSSIAAALMDARYLSGERTHYHALKRRLRREVFGVNPRAFVAAKLAERDRRHAKWGDSRFMLEPNIKEGKGGLRDLHTLTWLARYCYRVNKAAELVRSDLLTPAEWRHYRQAYLFFATVRAHLHLLRGRADERLTFDAQTHIATQLKFRGRTLQEKAERLMLRYFQFAREVGMLTRIFCAVLEEENLRVPVAPFTADALERALGESFLPDNGRLNFAPGTDLIGAPVLVVELFHAAQQHGLDIHPRAHLAIARALPTIGRRLPFEGEANRLLLGILLANRSPEVTLKRMSEMGVLGALIPEFGRVTGMMQYDGYHTYTVEEHTLVAVGNLFTIESGAWIKDMPLATAVAQEIRDRAPLYLAMLCHDLAKGMGGGHAEKGEAIVERIAARLGLDTATAQLSGWLVKHHLILSETAFKRDLDDPKTIEDFVERVQSPERLRLLLLITVADIKAVGPAIWNRWKGGLMRDLYHRAMLRMGVGIGEPMQQLTIDEKLLREVPDEARDAAQHFLRESLPTSWWYRPREEQVASIRAYAAWRADASMPQIVTSHDPFRGVSEVTIAHTYMPELFRLLAGVMAWIGASIVSARTMVLGSGVAITTLGIQDMEGNSFERDAERLAPLGALITTALSGGLDFASELPRRRALSRGREVAVAPMVFIDNQVSASATVIEVNARDRLGLLYDMLGGLAECQLQVTTAHIATYGQKAVDVFYVKDAYGIKITHPAKLATIKQALLDVCGAAS